MRYIFLKLNLQNYYLTPRFFFFAVELLNDRFLLIRFHGHEFCKINFFFAQRLLMNILLF